MGLIPPFANRTDPVFQDAIDTAELTGIQACLAALSDSKQQKIYGDRMAAARVSAGLTRGQVIRLLGWHVSKKTELAAFEAGACLPSAAQVIQLCRLYHIHSSWLFLEALHFDSPQAAFAAAQEGEITDDQFLQWMIVDRPAEGDSQVEHGC